MQEKPEVHQDYTKSLGLFLCFSNEKSNLAQIFKLDVNQQLLKNDKVSTQIELNTKEEGQYKFKLFFCDNFGFSNQQEMTFTSK
jgi:hypothetical protein